MDWSSARTASKSPKEIKLTRNPSLFLKGTTGFISTRLHAEQGFKQSDTLQLTGWVYITFVQVNIPECYSVKYGACSGPFTMLILIF